MGKTLNNNIVKILNLIILTIAALTISTTCFGTKKLKLVVKSSIQNNTGKNKKVQVTITNSQKETRVIFVNADFKTNIPLEYRNTYTLTFYREGYAKKRIHVNTALP